MRAVPNYNEKTAEDAFAFSQAAVRKIASELRHANAAPPPTHPDTTATARRWKESRKDGQTERARA